MPITLRRARRNEADALTDLAMRSKQSNGYDDVFMAECRDALTVSQASLTRAEYWVADDDGLLGCAALSPMTEAGEAEIHTFFIAPEAKRRGVGRVLWAQMLKRARAVGIVRLTLDADPAAVPFYEAMGLQVVGTVPSGSIPGRSLPKMAITLT